MAELTRLVDTSIFVDYLRGNETAKNWLNGFQQGELAYSVVTGAELVAGCRNRREQELVEKELALYHGVSFNGDFFNGVGLVSPISFKPRRRFS